jgi:inosine-uridine nucleoside N-ribohydrolase
MNSDPKFPMPSRREFLGASAGIALGGFLGEALAAPGGRTASLASHTAVTAPSPSPRRIIIDTDPGVDDAFAILLALRSPELQVEAITPVSGNVPLEITLPNALRLVEIAGRPDIPVAAGASVPLTRRLITASYVHGEDGFGGVNFPPPKIKPVSESATEIIRRIVRAHPGEVTIVAVGPLTNVATALRSDPELAHMIPQFVLMGGSISGGNITPAAEFNFYVDPEAAHVVFHSGVPIDMVGLDVTRKVQLTEKHAAALEAGSNPVSQAAGKIARSTIEHYRRTGFPGDPMMHDPLALATLLDSTLVKFRDYYVNIEIEGELTAGESLAYDHAPVRHSAPIDNGAPVLDGRNADEPFHPNTRVAVDVNSERFMSLLVSRLTGTSS